MMAMLTLSLFFPRKDVALLAAFGAVGVGIGGDMTYGQTVGFIVQAQTFWWGFLGLALKGAVWGALAGAVISLVFTPRPRLVLTSGVVAAGATWVGWRFINHPKLIYFSHPTDRPREEVWAGFLLAAIALTLFQVWQGRAQPAVRLTTAGFVGGGIGFGIGGAIQGAGKIFAPQLNLHWWKYMEFFFGYCFGWALAWAFAHSTLADEDGAAQQEPAAWLEMLGAVAISACFFLLEERLRIRFSYLLIGAAVLAAVSQLRWLARHVAYSVTFAAAAFDLADQWSGAYKRGAAEPAYTLAILAGLAFAWVVRRYHGDTLRMLEILTWACVAIATLKFALHPIGLVNLVDHIELAFVLMAAAVSWMARRVAGGLASHPQR